MVSRPEDRPKVIVLGISVLVLLLYVFLVQVPKMLTTHVAPPPPAPPVAVTTAKSANQTSNALAQFTAATAVPAAPPPPPAVVDLYADVDEPGPTVSDPFSTPLPDPSATPPMPVKPVSLPGLTVSASSLSVLPHTPPAPWPNIELQGVVPGRPSIAVLHVDGQTYYKTEGDQVAGGVRVAKISEAGVVLQRDQINVTLEVGHSTQTPQSAPHRVAGSAPMSSRRDVVASLPLTDETEQSAPAPEPVRIKAPVATVSYRVKALAPEPARIKAPVDPVSHDVVEEPILPHTQVSLPANAPSPRIRVAHRRAGKRLRVHIRRHHRLSRLHRRRRR